MRSEREAFQFPEEFLQKLNELSDLLDKFRPGTGPAVALFCQDSYEKGWQAARSAAPPNDRVCNNPLHALTDGSPHPHEIGPSCMAETVEEVKRQRDEYKEAAYRLENTIRLLRTEAAAAPNDAPSRDTCPKCKSGDPKIMLVAHSFRYGRWREIDELSCDPGRIDCNSWHNAPPVADSGASAGEEK